MTVMDEETIFDAVNAANGLNSDGHPTVSEPSNGQRTGDPDAPYGRTKSGVPRRKPGPSKGTRVGAAIPRAKRPSSGRKTGTDYRPGILGILQIPAFALGAAGQLNESLALDGAAISMHAPAIAEALNDLANDNPAVAAALDRILTAGPYGAIIGACLPLVFQIMANHERIPAGAARAGGALPRDEFRERLLAAQHG